MSRRGLYRSVGGSSMNHAAGRWMRTYRSQLALVTCLCPRLMKRGRAGVGTWKRPSVIEQKLLAIHQDPQHILERAATTFTLDSGGRILDSRLALRPSRYGG